MVSILGVETDCKFLGVRAVLLSVAQVSTSMEISSVTRAILTMLIPAEVMKESVENQ